MSEIFERTLNHKDGQEIRISVGRPTKINDSSCDWQCEYIIDSFMDSKPRMAVGVDQIQAIVLALTYISNTLYFSDDYKEGKLSWEGGMSRSDLGLPVAENVRADVQRLREQVDSMHSSSSG